MDPQDALFQVSKTGENEDLEELLNGDFKLDLNAGDSLGNTALHYSAASDHTKTVSLLIAAGCSVNARNNLGETPLHKVSRVVCTILSLPSFS